MLDIHRTDDAPDTKVFFSHSVLPSYIDPHNVSAKKKPFSSFNQQHFSHSLDLILPEGIWEAVRQEVQGVENSQYARCYMKLGEVLEEEFLDSYVRQGSIAMLSEGRPLVDNRFSLFDGALRLELDRPTYERCGLVGTRIEDGGKKHKNARWIVEFDLRSPAMRKGKKGFGRLQWACKNVLDASLAWLFWNANPSSAEALREGKEVLSKHAPKITDMTPEVSRLENIFVPNLRTRDLPNVYDEIESLDLLEYLHMLQLGSPRVNASDNIDPHLCRYDVPDFGTGTRSQNLMSVSWRGFMTPTFVRAIFLAVWDAGFKSSSNRKKREAGDKDGDVDMQDEQDEQADSKECEAWFAMSAQAFGGAGEWSLMQFTQQDTLVWHVEE
jgi:ribonuclease P/MRP protein subunit RPP40